MAPVLSHLILLSCITTATGFQSSVSQRNVQNQSRIPLARFEFILPSWLSGLFGNAETCNQSLQEQQPQNQDKSESTVSTANNAVVTRLAARKYDKQASKPSSRNYTTRKNAYDSITVTADGVVGDYNHYRTVALDSTPDRAISILTTDVMTALQASSSFSSCSDGDLGENVLIQDIKFNDIQVGKQYQFGSTVVVQVTEPMIPCANLCKLPFVNDENLAPKQRIVRCQALLEFLDKPGDGFRGWYAKVIVPGVIHVGDTFLVLESE